MYLSAIAMGYAVPAGNFDAAVHSVFQSAINLHPNDEDLLLTLFTSPEEDLPQGIRLDTPKDFSFEGFQTGEPAICRDNILHFKKTSLTVQLSNARRWKCDLPALKIDISNPPVSAAWSIVWEVLNKQQRLSQSEIVAEELFRSNQTVQNSVARKARAAMRDLLRLTWEHNLTDISAVNSLIGLGPGLTPSGDDLLVGYLAGLWCAVQDSDERVRLISSLGETITHLSSKTNDISRTYLYHAVQGQVSSRLANLAEAISRWENPERLIKIAETAMKVGHTSGMDTVTGLLIGLTAWQGNRLFSR